jgi:hypothetical protein
MLASSALSAAGSLAASYNKAAMSDRDARIAEANAKSASRLANQREEQSRRDARQALGAQAATVAQSGTGMGGSNALVMRQAGADAELDALNARHEGVLKRYAFLNEAQSDRFAAKTARIGGWIGAGSSLLSATGDYLKTK